MADKPDKKPVLMTEGIFAHDEHAGKKPSQADQEESAPPTSDSKVEQEQNASESKPETSPVNTSTDSQPAAAPDGEGNGETAAAEEKPKEDKPKEDKLFYAHRCRFKRSEVSFIHVSERERQSKDSGDQKEIAPPSLEVNGLPSAAADAEDVAETLSEKPSEAGDGSRDGGGDGARDQGDFGDQDEYVPSPEDPIMRSLKYMEKHKVMQIFQKLTAEIVYHRPPDPLDHILGEVQKMIKERDARIDAIISPSSSKSQPAWPTGE